MLRGDLNGKEVQNGGAMCVCVTDSFCRYSNNEVNVVKQLYANKN